MKTTTNWPGGVDRSSPNWSGRTPRTNEWGGAWAPDSHRIGWRRGLAWGGGIIALLAILMLLGRIGGFVV